jgi:hypothetical protein
MLETYQEAPDESEQAILQLGQQVPLSFVRSVVSGGNTPDEVEKTRLRMALEPFNELLSGELAPVEVSARVESIRGVGAEALLNYVPPSLEVEAEVVQDAVEAKDGPGVVNNDYKGLIGLELLTAMQADGKEGLDQAPHKKKNYARAFCRRAGVEYPDGFLNCDLEEAWSRR